MNHALPIATADAVEWFNHTTLHPLGVACLLCLGVAMLLVPRRWALAPLLLLVCMVPTAQRVVVATLDFDFLRVMILFGWIRLFMRGEIVRLAWKPLDTMLVAWLVLHTCTGILLDPTFAQFINRLGHSFDALGAYFLCRLLVRDWRDVRSLARCVAVICIPVAAAFAVERLTGRNMFAVLGGVREMTTIRAGMLRCQGPFAHPIIAGVFWAALAPLVAVLGAYRGWDRLLAIAGITSIGFIVLACASSTPAGALMVGAAVTLLFPARRWLWLLRCSVAAALLVAHLAMTKPVWHLLARVDLFSGSTGWYRYRLIDDFIRSFQSWWLMGTSSRDAWWSDGGFAITNEYVLQGIDGGIATLLLFVGMIVVAFRSVGATLRQQEQPRAAPAPSARFRRALPNRRPLLMAWSLGVCLVIHVVAFLGVAYFGQATLVWHLTLAVIASMAPAPQRVRRRMRVRRIRVVQATRGQSWVAMGA